MNETKAQTDGFREALKEITKQIENVPNNLQNIHTPFDLCHCIIDKLKGYESLENKDFCVFNLEFVEILCYDFGVPLERIWFLTDCKEKAAIARSERYKGVNVMKEDFFEMLKEKKEGRKFDVVVGNPPYQVNSKIESKNGSKGSRNTIWEKFVSKSIEVCKENGYVSLVHPPRWRKPQDNTGKLLKSKNLLYLEMHNKNDGMKTFGCMTRYDWYILINSSYDHKTTVKDENGNISNINLDDFPFLSHFDFGRLQNLLPKNGEERCGVLFSRSSYGSDKAWMSEEQIEEFKYPCIHSTTKDKIRYWYSSHRNNGHFGVAKVVFGDNGGDTGIANAILDMEGKYGITQHAIGIKIDSKEEGENIIKAIESAEFTKIINGCNWGGFQIDWRMFALFKKDFWKEFV